MPSNQLPRRLLYGELLVGKRPVGRLKLCFSNHIKSVLRKCNIPKADLEQLAADRDSWRSTCATGLESFAAASDQAASDRCACRHATAQAVRVAPACPRCGRVWVSDFSLRSHPCVYQRSQWQYHYSARHRRHRRTATSKQAFVRCTVSEN